jgi:hypothetical protein
LREDAVSSIKSNTTEERKALKNACHVDIKCVFEDGKAGAQLLSFQIYLNSSYDIQ